MEAGLDVVRLNFSHGVAQVTLIVLNWCALWRATRVARSVCWSTCKGRKSASASSRTTKSPWPRVTCSFWIRPVRSAINPSRPRLQRTPNDVTRASPCCWTMAALNSGRRCQGHGNHLQGSAGGGAVQQQGASIAKAAACRRCAHHQRHSKTSRRAGCVKGGRYLAVSFPRCGADMRQARELLRAAVAKACWLPKIERTKRSRTLRKSSMRLTPSWWRAATSESSGRCGGSCAAKTHGSAWRSSATRW